MARVMAGLSESPNFPMTLSNDRSVIEIYAYRLMLKYFIEPG
jgi:hypothetical protein